MCSKKLSWTSERNHSQQLSPALCYWYLIRLAGLTLIDRHWARLVFSCNGIARASDTCFLYPVSFLFFSFLIDCRSSLILLSDWDAGLLYTLNPDRGVYTEPFSNTSAYRLTYGGSHRGWHMLFFTNYRAKEIWKLSYKRVSFYFLCNVSLNSKNYCNFHKCFLYSFF